MAASFMKTIFLAITALILFFIYLRYLEHKSLYFPLKEVEFTPKDAGLDYEVISLTTGEGLKLHGWFIPSEAPRFTVLFCHGNGGNIGHRIEKIKMFNELDLNVLIFDYRGYGMSEGSPSEKGLYHDAELFYDYLVKEKGISYEKIISYGESLGGAVVIELAMRREMGAIIIESSFTSVGEMAKRVVPFLPAFVYNSRFDSINKISHISCPKLFFHSADDEIVPFEQGMKLFEAATGPKEIVRIQGGHNDGFMVSKHLFISKIDSFLSSLSNKP